MKNDSIKELQRRYLIGFLHDWEELLRLNYKYSVDKSTTLDEVSELYYNLRRECLTIDLTEIDLEDDE